MGIFSIYSSQRLSYWMATPLEGCEVLSFHGGSIMMTSNMRMPKFICDFISWLQLNLVMSAQMGIALSPTCDFRPFLCSSSARNQFLQCLILSLTFFNKWSSSCTASGRRSTIALSSQILLQLTSSSDMSTSQSRSSSSFLLLRMRLGLVCPTAFMLLRYSSSSLPPSRSSAARLYRSKMFTFDFGLSLQLLAGFGLIPPNKYRFIKYRDVSANQSAHPVLVFGIICPWFYCTVEWPVFMYKLSNFGYYLLNIEIQDQQHNLQCYSLKVE